MKEIVIRMKSIGDLNLISSEDWSKLKKSDLLEVEYDGQIYRGLNGLKLNIVPPEVRTKISEPDQKWTCEITLEQDVVV